MSEIEQMRLVMEAGLTCFGMLVLIGIGLAVLGLACLDEHGIHEERDR